MSDFELEDYTNLENALDKAKLEQRRARIAAAGVTVLGIGAGAITGAMAGYYITDVKELSYIFGFCTWLTVANLHFMVGIEFVEKAQANVESAQSALHTVQKPID